MKKALLITLSIITLAGGWIAHRTELDFGRSIDNYGNGKLYNGESYFNYIHYPEKVHANDIVMTLCILNPLNNECDDIIYRADAVILHDTPAYNDYDEYPTY